MNNVGRILLIVGAVVLALLVGIVIGRHHQADSPTADPAAGGVQISTEAPPAPPPAVATKLPTVPEAPPPAPAPAPAVKVDPNAQVDDDAAAAGMTTRDQPDAAPSAAPTTGAAQGEPEAPPT